ncbi:MAG: rhodanese-like domain-containing protein [Candidatus Omnitrophota bacterium]|nr:rhodanese-like domain-containing protein [Candidatus Omnitrophota bacterium]
MLTKKIVIFSIALFSLVCVFSCGPKGKESGKHEKTQETSSNTAKDHRHANHSEQAACPICNIKLLMEKGYREISLEEFKKLQKSNEAFIAINTLPPYFYRKEHIINSINIPTEDIESITPKIIKPEAKIVLYCKDYNCHVSTEAAEKLVKLGYKSILIYQGGMKEWKEGGNKISGIKGASEEEPSSIPPQ